MASDMAFTTYVFQHKDVEAAKALRKEIFDRYPFGCDSDNPTTVCGVMSGDALSVADAIRMAHGCRALDSVERQEFAAELGEKLTWDECLAVAAKWDLDVEDGEFVNAKKVSA